MTAHAVRLDGQSTVLSCWRALGATPFGPGHLVETPLATAAVFPDFGYLNNAILTAGIESVDAAAVAVAEVYEDAGIATWALWVPSSTRTLDPTADLVPAVGSLTRDVTTVFMRRDLTAELRTDDRVRTVTNAALRRLVMEEPVPLAALGTAEPDAEITGWALMMDGRAVATAHTHFHGADCGIYAVGTPQQWRRRGFARALVEHVLAHARDAGMRTATLQSTPMGLPLYEALGFTAVGRYEEWLHA